MAKANPFKEGQVVILKSGGVSMVIESFETDPSNPDKIYAICVWQDKNKPYREKYSIDVLESDEDDSDAPLGMMMM